MEDKEILKNKSKLLPGGGISWYKFKQPVCTILQTFKNPLTSKGVVVVSSKEVTALCPLTGFPDQYEVMIEYIPQGFCVESKSVKFYLGAYRDYKGFIETITRKICDDFWEVLKPKELFVSLTMNARGGVVITAKETRSILK